MANATDLLQTLEQALAGIERDDDVSDAWTATFWDAFYDLYVLTLEGQDAETMARISEFLEATAPRVESRISPMIMVQLDRLDGKLDSVWEYDEWLTVCRMRSALEGFNELYLPYFADKQPVGADEDTDAAIRDRSARDGFASKEEDPELFDTSHWWWHLNKPVGMFGL